MKKGANLSVLFPLCLVTTLFFGSFLLHGPVRFGAFAAASTADPTTLAVNVTTYQDNVATTYDYMVVAAIVEASGSPVSGVSVTFSDSLGSTFLGSTATTNSSGEALTTVQFNSGNTGLDTINATASATGYSSGIGSATVSVLGYGSTQLAIEPSITNTVATGGSTDVVSGKVVYAGNYYGMYTKPVAGATVAMTDTIGSTFSTATILSDNNGFFSSNFTIAQVETSAIDLVTFSASCSSYSSSQSTIMLQVAPYSTGDLTVAMNAFFPSATLTTYNYMVVEAEVTTGGTPVSGASVAFSDSFGSTFMGSTAITNSTGIALTTVQFTSANTGTDVVTASASQTGYSGGVASNTVEVLGYGSTQLAIEPSITNTVATGGSTDVVSGKVVYAGNYYGMYTKPVAGATVAMTDTIGSTFSTATILSDNNGFFSSNFTIAQVDNSLVDLVTLSCSDISYSSSQSTVILQVSPYGSNDLTVAMNAFFPSATSTTYNYMVIGTEVTAGGSPVSGVSVTFSDSLGSTFLGSTATTNSSGEALTTVQFNSGNTGIDVITASASKSGYNRGVGSNIVSVLGYGSTQLAIEPSITNTVATGGSTDVVSGKVVYAGNYYGMYTKPVAGATVTLVDTIGSIFNVTSVLTDSQGYFSASFTLPSVASTRNDITMVSASEPGYSGSSSAVYMQVTSVPAVGWNLPSAPLNLSASAAIGSIVVKWEPSASSGTPPNFTGSGIENYSIYRATASGNELYYDEVNGNTLEYTDSSVNNGTVYFYEVVAINPQGQSGFSNEAQASSPSSSSSSSSSIQLLFPWDIKNLLLPLTVFVVIFVTAVFLLKRRL